MDASPWRCVAATIELSVLVPCFNEEGNLPELVERTERVFHRCGITGEIVLVNDGSVDGTRPQIETLAAAHPCVVGVHHPTNRGIAAGWKSGLERSQGRYVCTIDADLQYQPEAIAQLYREITFSKVDLVQGWRSSLERQRYDYRYYLSRGLDRLLKLAFAMREHDVKSGFVIYKREVFEDILRDAPHYFCFQHMITVVAKARGYSLRQVETLFEERRVGHSFIGMFPVRMVARTLVDIGRGVVETRLREPKDMSLAGIVGAEPRQAREEPSGGSSVLHRALLRFHQPTVSRNAPRYLEELRRTQWLSPEDIEQLQMRRLRRLAQHATEHVRYWREALGTAGLVPDDLRTLADLGRIPPLDKHALRENIYFDLLADNSEKRKMCKLVTCGSTGEPLPVFVDQLQRDMRWANAMRNVEWTGYRFGEPRAHLSHAGAGVPVREALAEWTHALFARRWLFPSFPVDAALLRRFAQHVRRHPATLIEGDTEVLALVALLLSAQGVPSLGAKAILTAGQTLSPETRQLIERQLGARVFDRYQSGEFGPIAQECERSRGYHVNAESYIVEVVREGQPAREGEVGDVLVTDLNNRCLPLLRYRLADLAAISRRRCACGRGLPLLERIVGRSPSAVRGADGRYVPASFFARLFGDYEYAVRAYQVLQDSPGRILVRVVRTSRFTEMTEAEVRNRIAAVLGPGTIADVESVAAIPRDAIGTVRPCVSTVVPAPLASTDSGPWEQPARREASS